ncbi:MAG: hypothetical protein KC643_31485 [Nitrospira sp.]|nr:hypothetical protein [Nitrospira sp.]
MVLKALQPITVKMPDGSQRFIPGETITLPDPVGYRLLELTPGRVMALDGTGQTLQMGMTVQYRIPVGSTAFNYTWEWHEGVIQTIDEYWERALVVPMDESVLWRWISLVYVKC